MTCHLPHKLRYKLSIQLNKHNIIDNKTTSKYFVSVVMVSLLSLISLIYSSMRVCAPLS